MGGSPEKFPNSSKSKELLNAKSARPSTEDACDVPVEDASCLPKFVMVPKATALAAEKYKY